MTPDACTVHFLMRQHVWTMPEVYVHASSKRSSVDGPFWMSRAAWNKQACLSCCSRSELQPQDRAFIAISATLRCIPVQLRDQPLQKVYGTKWFFHRTACSWSTAPGSMPLQIEANIRYAQLRVYTCVLKVTSCNPLRLKCTKVLIVYKKPNGPLPQMLS